LGKEVTIVLSDEALERLDQFVKRNPGSSRDSLIETMIMSAERADLFLRLFTGKGLTARKSGVL